MNDTAGDPRDKAGEQQNGRQEVLGPNAALQEQTLAVDLARAEIDQQIATAHRFPRKIDVVVNKIEQLALYNEAAAENSIYSLPRAGKAIVGASIGMANIVAGAWGNCRDGARITYIDRKEKMVVAEGVFHDLESNRLTIIPVNRRIVDKNGRLFNDDMIMVTGMAAGSIARRNAILNAVPRSLWFPVYEKALFIVRGTEATLAERRDKAVKALASFGIDPKQVFLFLQVKGVNEIGVQHMPTLRGMFTALRDGSITPEEMFDPRRMTGKTFETVDNPLADQEDGDTETVDPETGETSGGAGQAQATQTAATTTVAATGAAETVAQGTATPDQGQATQGAAQGGAEGGGAGEPQPGGGQQQAAPATATAAPAADQKPKPAKAAKAEAEPAGKPEGPQSSAEYVEHALAWLDSADERNWPAPNIEDTWKGERKMRERCNVVEDDFDKVNGRYRTVLKAAKERDAKQLGK